MEVQEFFKSEFSITHFQQMLHAWYTIISRTGLFVASLFLIGIHILTGGGAVGKVSVPHGLRAEEAVDIHGRIVAVNDQTVAHSN